MYLSEMQDILSRMTDEELQIVKNDICSIIEKRSRAEEDKALTEMVSTMNKWAEHDIIFYIHDNDDQKLIIYPNELCVERGWI